MAIIFCKKYLWSVEELLEGTWGSFPNPKTPFLKKLTWEIWAMLCHHRSKLINFIIPLSIEITDVNDRITFLYNHVFISKVWTWASLELREKARTTKTNHLLSYWLFLQQYWKMKEIYLCKLIFTGKSFPKVNLPLIQTSTDIFATCSF